MQIKNVRSYALEIAKTGQLVEPGESVEVDDDLGKSLLEQPDNWAGEKKSKTTTATAPKEG